MSKKLGIFEPIDRIVRRRPRRFKEHASHQGGPGVKSVVTSLAAVVGIITWGNTKNDIPTPEEALFTQKPLTEEVIPQQQEYKSDLPEEGKGNLSILVEDTSENIQKLVQPEVPIGEILP